MILVKAFCLTALVALTAASRAAAQPVTVPLSAFKRLRLCAPFGALVKPGKAYSLTLDAEQSVKNAVTTAIDPSGVLTIGTSEVFSSAQPIRMTVTLPPAALAGIAINTPVTSQVTVAPGFTPPTTFEASTDGSGNLFLQKLDVPSISVVNNGAGQLYVKGSYKTATVSASGAGGSYLGGGTIGTATISAGGVASVVVDPTNNNAQITGSAQLLGKILYTMGTCTLSGSNIPGVTNNPAAAAVSQLLGSNPFGALSAGGGCTKVAASPITAPIPQWTCGLRVQGTFDCSGSFSGGNSASTSGGGIISTSSGGGISTSTSGNGIASASGSGGGQVQFSSAGPGQTASITNTGAVQTTPCAKEVTADALNVKV